MSRRWILALAILFVAVGNVCAQSPEPGMLFLYPERVILKDGGFFNAKRGMMFVPLNRSKKNSVVIAVEVYRFKRSERANPETPPEEKPFTVTRGSHGAIRAAMRTSERFRKGIMHFTAMGICPDCPMRLKCHQLNGLFLIYEEGRNKV